MCGIVAYNGSKEAYPVLIKGLSRLEYRGYDSAGVAFLNEGDISLFKKRGKVDELVKLTKGNTFNATIGIGHTRWATHGIPNDANSHPHVSQSQNIKS